MKKFQILKWILVLFIIGSFAAISSNIWIISKLVSSVGFYYFYRSCAMFIKRGYFNYKSSVYLKTGGYILMIKSALSLIIITVITIDTSELSDSQSKADLIMNISSCITSFIIGFSLIAASDVIKKGNVLKQENDLTI